MALFHGKDPAVYRIFAPVLLVCLAMPCAATDITLLVGYQYNSNFEISSADEWPPRTEGDTGEPGDNVDLDDAAAVSLAVDFPFEGDMTKRIGFYVSYEQTRFESNAGLTDRDLDVTHLHFTAASYYPEGNLEPFVEAGLGAGYYAPKDSSLKDETRLSGQIGAGTNYRFSDSFLLRTDIRWLVTFFNSSGSAFCDGGCTIAVSSETYSQVQANIGLMYRF
jgi:opacity protein-like surface antigen